MQHIDNNNAESLNIAHGPNGTPSLIDYLLVILKYWKMIFGRTFIVAVITAILSLFMDNIYTAKTIILPGDDDKGMMGAMLAQLGGLAGIAGGALGGTNKLDMYVTMLKSETVKDPIIDKFKLMDVYEAKYRSDIYKKLDADSVISAGKKDGVITINVSNKDPKLAADLANAYVDELAKIAAGLSMTGAGNNRAFLEKRLAETKTDLIKAEDNLKAFQSKNKAVSVSDQAKASIEGVAQLRAQLAIQEVQLGILQHQFTDSSKEVKTAKATIANLRSQIASLEGAGGSSSSIPSVGSMPQLGQEYVRLMREFKIQETILELLTKQYEMVKINELKDVSPFQIIQKAKVPDRKSKPKRSKIVLGVAFFVGILMTALAFLKEHTRHMQPEDHERTERVLALLPRPVVRLWRWLVA